LNGAAAAIQGAARSATEVKVSRPTRYALISDIHANLPALEAVLADIAARGDDVVTYHLGDLVGYAPWPNEVVALLRERAIPGVAGNYDSTTATDYPHCGCQYEDPRQEELSHLSYEWTRAHTSPEAKVWLGGLPFRIDLRPLGGHRSGPRLILIHGNPVLNTVYWTDDRSDDFCLKMADHLGARPGDVIAFGHTHKPWHRTVDGRHFVNTGSVGRPKDEDWRAGYVVVAMDGEIVEVEFVRVPYDLERATSAIRDSELPEDFAHYLRTGGIPKPLAADAG
jgi:predicted phosphodiesterase